MLGYQALGIDVNPLARLISTVKSTRIPPSRLEVLGDKLLARADKGSPSYQLNPYLTDWFKPHATKALANLLNAISEVHDPASRNFFLVTLSSIIRRCSLADPSIPPPVKLNPRRAPRANLRYRRNLVSAMALTEATVYEQFRKAMSNNIRRINELGNLRNFGSVAILEPPAEAAGTTLPSNSVDVILTSPPYCGAQKYIRTLRLELCWLGYTDEEIARLDRNTLGTERVSLKTSLNDLLSNHSVEHQLVTEIWNVNRTRAVMLSNYLSYLHKFSAECQRICRPNGHIFVTFGTSRICGHKIDMASIFKRIALTNGLFYVTTLVDKIPSRGLLTRRHRSAGNIDDERVVWLRS